MERSIVRGHQVGAGLPGVMRMAREYTSVDGTTFRAGTLYRPISSGENNGPGRLEQVISIDGANYVFVAA